MDSTPNTMIAVPYAGRIKYHESLILRAAIAMKLYYSSVVSVFVVTNQRYFLDAMHQQYANLVPIMIVADDHLTRLPTGTTLVVSSKSHPIVPKILDHRLKLFEVPPYTSEKLDFESIQFGTEFTYPDLRRMLDLLPPAVASQRPAPFVLR